MHHLNKVGQYNCEHELTGISYLNINNITNMVVTDQDIASACDFINVHISFLTFVKLC